MEQIYHVCMPVLAAAATVTVEAAPSLQTTQAYHYNQSLQLPPALDA
jgi:hypothetical protein